MKNNSEGAQPIFFFCALRPAGLPSTTVAKNRIPNTRTSPRILSFFSQIEGAEYWTGFFSSHPCFPNLDAKVFHTRGDSSATPGCNDYSYFLKFFPRSGEAPLKLLCPRVWPGPINGKPPNCTGIPALKRRNRRNTLRAWCVFKALA